MDNIVKFFFWKCEFLNTLNFWKFQTGVPFNIEIDYSSTEIGRNTPSAVYQISYTFYCLDQIYKTVNI